MARSPARASKAAVWLSRSTSIYENLALEDWLFRRRDFTDRDGLLVWLNRPAVVVGRHQNVWAECDVRYALGRGVDVARRQSGGGAVYLPVHNLNFSFLTDSRRHDRPGNLDTVRRLLKQNYAVDAVVSPRHDLLINGRKVSGTAAKLSSKAAYHHFTLLVSTNLKCMHSLLRSSFAPYESCRDFSYQSNATKSVRSSVGWILQTSTHFSGHEFVDQVIAEFCSRYEPEAVTRTTVLPADICNAQYDGIEETVSELSSWDWIFGKNPHFTLTKAGPAGRPEEVVKMEVDKGLITRVTRGESVEKNVGSMLVGRKFDSAIWDKIYDNENRRQTRRNESVVS